MGCFIVPATEAVLTSVITKALGKEKTERLRLKWLSAMLWGGTILLAIEHIWHGEVVPWPPFLTAMANPSEVGTMLSEMAIVGGAMSVTITLFWLAIVYLASILPERHAARINTTA